eukprot:363197-Chlamydomonas_euryale.AAC.9
MQSCAFGVLAHAVGFDAKILERGIDQDSLPVQHLARGLMACRGCGIAMLPCRWVSHTQPATPAP